MRRGTYPSDLTDAQWEAVRGAMPRAEGGRTGCPRMYPLREIWNALLYQAKNGCTWRALPHEFPPWPAVWQQFRRWRDNGTLKEVHAALREGIRRKARRAVTPSALILDSQSVRTAEKRGNCWGYDAGKRIPGRKRHLITDTLGLIWAVSVHAANVQDRDGAKPLLRSLSEERLPRMQTVFADAGYRGKLEDWTAEELDLVLQIVPKIAGQNTFTVLPKRWIIERTFAWIMRHRRLRSEYETTVASSIAWIHTAMVHRMVRHLAPA